VHAISVQQARETITRLLEEYMGVEATTVLQDTPFVELHKEFDSLSMLELQLLLEKAHDMEFDSGAQGQNGKLPTNVTELAEVLVKQHAVYHARKARKLAQAQPVGDSASSSV